MSTLTNSGIFASPEDTKKVILSLSFVFFLTTGLAIMWEILPERSWTTDSFILNYFIWAFVLLLVYSLFTKKRDLVLPVSGCIAGFSVIFFVGNLFVNYEQDFQGTNPRLGFALLLIVMFITSTFRLMKYKANPNIESCISLKEKQ